MYSYLPINQLHLTGHKVHPIAQIQSLCGVHDEGTAVIHIQVTWLCGTILANLIAIELRLNLAMLHNNSYIQMRQTVCLADVFEAERDGNVNRRS